MKPILVFILFAFAIQTINAQNFEYTSIGEFDSANGVVEVDNEYIFVSSDDYERIVFIRLDATGALIEQKSVPILDSLCFVSGIYYIDSSFWVIGYGKSCKTCSFFNMSVWVGKFSNDFDLISVDFWPLASEVHTLTGRSYQVGNSMMLAGVAQRQQGSKKFLVKYTPAEDDYFVTADAPFYSYAPDVLSMDSSYVVYHGHVLGYADSLFNEVDKKTSPDLFSFVEGSILSHTDSTFAIFSEVVTDDLRSFLFGEINREYELLSWDTLYSAPLAGISGVWNLMAHDDALVVSPDGHYYVGGNHHYESSKVKPFLAKFDQNMNQIWSYKYSTPGELYFMLGMRATSDNGCLMYGFRELIWSNKEAFILKIGPDGVLTGETIIPFKDQITVYPNPAKDYFQLELPNESVIANITLIDVSGRVVLSQKTTHNEQVDISFLPKGLYELRVTDLKGNLIGVGKVVTE